MAINKASNEYAQLIDPIYDCTPKAVLAAIAVSYATRAGEHQREAVSLILREWETLYFNGIVSQKPPKHP